MVLIVLGGGSDPFTPGCRIPPPNIQWSPIIFFSCDQRESSFLDFWRLFILCQRKVKHFPLWRGCLIQRKVTIIKPSKGKVVVVCTFTTLFGVVFLSHYWFDTWMLWYAFFVNETFLERCPAWREVGGIFIWLNSNFLHNVYFWVLHFFLSMSNESQWQACLGCLDHRIS